ncbi:hypothetical protein ABID99_004735 [Mucilaginibacter sp. OAE612]
MRKAKSYKLAAFGFVTAYNLPGQYAFPVSLLSCLNIPAFFNKLIINIF